MAGNTLQKLIKLMLKKIFRPQYFNIKRYHEKLSSAQNQETDNNTALLLDYTILKGITSK